MSLFRVRFEHTISEWNLWDETYLNARENGQKKVETVKIDMEACLGI